MTFLPLDLCRELQAAGCKSESGSFYNDETKGADNQDQNWRVRHLFEEPFVGRKTFFAFTLLDFIAPSIQARENARIQFGTEMVCTYCGCPSASARRGCPDCINTTQERWIYCTHFIVDLDPSADVGEYFRKHRRAA